jgi:hypothetical protein
MIEVSSQVGIVMRTKNRPELLRRSVASVCSQSFTNWRLSVVNDGGNSLAVARIIQALPDEFRSRVTVTNLQSSVGMEAASNVGVSKLDCDLLVVHDDDDTWDRDFLKSTVAFLDGNPDHLGVVTLSTAIVEEIRGQNVFEIQRYSYNPDLHTLDIPMMLSQNHFPPISFVFRKMAWEKVGGFDESLPVLGDWDFNVKVLLLGEVGVIREAHANYHFRTNPSGPTANSVTSGKNLHGITRSKIINMNIRSGPLTKDQLGQMTFNSALHLSLVNQINELRQSLLALETRIIGLQTTQVVGGNPTGLLKILSTSPRALVMRLLALRHFSARSYLQLHPDLVGVRKPLVHYLFYGIFEGRKVK